MTAPYPIDLHLHTTVSDGTDTPAALLDRVREAGIRLFSVTDHDATKGCAEIAPRLRAGDPDFLTGVEFSTKDEEGQYHILGYGYDPDAPAIGDVVAHGHALRMNKLRQRLDFLRDAFGFSFSEADEAALFALDNPGKPHLGNLMVRYGFASSKEEAIEVYLNRHHAGSAYVRPEEAIAAIRESGGIPVLAHPAYGRGDEILVGEAMARRLARLTAFGLRGVEAFYSGFSPKLTAETLAFAARFDLLVTAGSDYHGNNKTVALGDTNLPAAADYPAPLLRFLAEAAARSRTPRAVSRRSPPADEAADARK